MRFVAVRLRAERFSAKRSAWKLSAALTADTVPFQVISRTGLSRVETLTKCSGICLMLQSPSEQSAAQHLVNVQRTTSEILLVQLITIISITRSSRAFTRKDVYKLESAATHSTSQCRHGIKPPTATD